MEFLFYYGNCMDVGVDHYSVINHCGTA